MRLHLLLPALLGVVLGATDVPVAIPLDPAAPGLAYEGVGALSAGASTRLLIDYPEPQRSQVLDLLFKPAFGASLQHCKVEIGGDCQSTDGTEPSIARTREEFDHPTEACFQRGYEWWLMREARRRVPGIPLDVLQWGAPGWIGATDAVKPGQFFSADNADFIAAFILGAKRWHGLDINYCGLWNERDHDPKWIPVLRRTLDAKGLNAVRIIANDACEQSKLWRIGDDMAKDPAVRDAVGVVGVHYPRNQPTPPAVLAFGKPVWSCEDGPWKGTWEGARIIAQQINRNYAEGRRVKTIIWALVSSYYDNLGLPSAGLMRANEPWCGHYEVQPAIWAVAHTTQFIQPGWRYADPGCGVLSGGGSHVVAYDPAVPTHWSVVVETMDAKSPQTVVLPAAGAIHVWRSTKSAQFERLPDLGPDRTFVVEPEAIYSFTTTDGQTKGSFAAVPVSAPFPFPWREDFADAKPTTTPRYLSDQCGGFEVVKRVDGGQALRQVVPRQPIEWTHIPWPYTIAGNSAWSDYTAACRVLVPVGAEARLMVRVGKGHDYGGQGLHDHYHLALAADGTWALRCVNTKKESVLATGTALGTGWRRLTLTARGTTLTAAIDEKTVATVTDATFSSGMIGLGCGGYHPVEFTDLAVEP